MSDTTQHRNVLGAEAITVRTPLPGIDDLDGSGIIDLQEALARLTAPSTTGASAGGRLAGGIASGSPTTGTWAVGDTVIDRTGTIWICTTAGTGTAAKWVDVSKVEVVDKVDGTPSTNFTSTAAAQLIPGMSHNEALLARPHHVTHRYLIRHTVALGAFWIQTYLDGVAVDATYHIASGSTANVASTFTTMHRVPVAAAGDHTIEGKILLVTAGTLQTNPGGGQPCHMIIDRA